MFCYANLEEFLSYAWFIGVMVTSEARAWFEKRYMLYFIFLYLLLYYVNAIKALLHQLASYSIYQISELKQATKNI